MLSVYLMCCKGCPRQPHGIDFKKKLLGALLVGDIRKKFYPLPAAFPKSFSDQDIFWLYNYVNQIFFILLISGIIFGGLTQDQALRKFKIVYSAIVHSISPTPDNPW